MNSQKAYFQSPLGTLCITVDTHGITELKYAASATSSQTQHPVLKKCIRQLKEYFSGKRTRFDLPLNPQGTDFQKKVWKALQTIPYSQTASYQEIALKIKKPKAMRAVGNANGKNPITIVIPCHRVIRNNGALGGYSSGLSKKKKLLALESKSKK